MVKIKTSKPEVLWNAKCILGEGTLWVKEHKSIYFTDIKKKRIHILNIKNNKSKIIKINKEIGFLAHIKNSLLPFDPLIGLGVIPETSISQYFVNQS